MTATDCFYQANYLLPQWSFLWLVACWSVVVLIGLLWACMSTLATIERTQTANLRLAQTIYSHLHNRDWQTIEALCAEKVLYQSRASRFTEEENIRSRFLTHPKNGMLNKQPAILEIRQFCPAAEHHSQIPLPIFITFKKLPHEHLTRYFQSTYRLVQSTTGQ